MRWLAVIVTLSSCLAVAVWANDKSSKPHAAGRGRSIDGEQVYSSNCTRCHNTPPTLTERQTRVVVRHMRVRANLLADQSDAVLDYLTESARRK
jgi:cytochrome c553